MDTQRSAPTGIVSPELAWITDHQRVWDYALAPPSEWRPPAASEERSVMSQRNLIYVVGAIIVIVVLVYFLRT
jgi:hypothetical protein